MKYFPHKNTRYTPVESSFRAKVSNYKAHSKLRKLEWSLHTEYAISLLKANCNYCGSAPTNSYNAFTRNRMNSKMNVHNPERRKDFEIRYNGIDRIDNSLGYIDGNVVTCCERCNSAKSDSTHDAFINWLNNLTTYRKSL